MLCVLFIGAKLGTITTSNSQHLDGLRGSLIVYDFEDRFVDQFEDELVLYLSD